MCVNMSLHCHACIPSLTSSTYLSPRLAGVGTNYFGSSHAGIEPSATNDAAFPQMSMQTRLTMFAIMLGCVVHVSEWEDIPGLVDGNSVIRLACHATVRVLDSLLAFGGYSG